MHLTFYAADSTHFYSLRKMSVAFRHSFCHSKRVFLSLSSHFCWWKKCRWQKLTLPLTIARNHCPSAQSWTCSTIKATRRVCRIRSVRSRRCSCCCCCCPPPTEPCSSCCWTCSTTPPNSRTRTRCPRTTSPSCSPRTLSGPRTYAIRFFLFTLLDLLILCLSDNSIVFTNRLCF